MRIYIYKYILLEHKRTNKNNQQLRGENEGEIANDKSQKRQTKWGLVREWGLTRRDRRVKPGRGSNKSNL